MSELNLLGLFNKKKTSVFTIKFKALDKNGELKTIKFRFQTHNENDRLLIKTFMIFMNDKLMSNNCEPVVVGEPFSEKGKSGAHLQENQSVKKKMEIEITKKTTLQPDVELEVIEEI